MTLFWIVTVSVWTLLLVVIASRLTSIARNQVQTVLREETKHQELLKAIREQKD
jgi:hypothetical protein